MEEVNQGTKRKVVHGRKVECREGRKTEKGRARELNVERKKKENPPSCMTNEKTFHGYGTEK